MQIRCYNNNKKFRQFQLCVRIIYTPCDLIQLIHHPGNMMMCGSLFVSLSHFVLNEISIFQSIMPFVLVIQILVQ